MKEQLIATNGKAKLSALSDKILLKIISHLSTYDILKRVALVSTKFHQLSQHPDIIKTIELDPRSNYYHFENILKNDREDEDSKDEQESLLNGILKVITRSKKLKNLALTFYIGLGK